MEACSREQQREERNVLFPYSYMVASISLNWSFDQQVVS